jgi:hypothetical protein
MSVKGQGDADGLWEIKKGKGIKSTTVPRLPQLQLVTFASQFTTKAKITTLVIYTSPASGRFSIEFLPCGKPFSFYFLTRRYKNGSITFLHLVGKEHALGAFTSRRADGLISSWLSTEFTVQSIDEKLGRLGQVFLFFARDCATPIFPSQKSKSKVLKEAHTLCTQHVQRPALPC